jgi:hypothetical protein
MMDFADNRVKKLILIGRSHLPLRRAVQLVLTLLLTITPVLLTIRNISLYAVDVPITDGWDLWIGPESPRGDTPLIESIASRWRLRNEGAHRQFTSQMLGFAYLKVAPLSMIPAYGFAVLLAALTLIVLIDAARRVHIGRLSGATGILISMLIFTDAASVRWLNSNVVVIIQGVCFSIASFWLLTAPLPSGRKFVLALLSAALAATSFASGNITLIVGGLGLLFTPYRRWRYLLAWAIVSALLLGSYIWDRLLISDDPISLTRQQGFGSWLQFILSSFGSPLTPLSDSAVLVSFVLGLVGIVTVTSLLVWLWRSGQLTTMRITFWIFLLAWLLLNSAQIGVARVNDDGSNALRVRYLIYGSLFWVSIVALGAPLIERSRYRRGRAVAFGGLVAILCLHVAASGSVLLSGESEDFSAEKREGLACLQAYDFRSPCLYGLENIIPRLQMAIPYVYQYQPTFLNTADESPNLRYQFYLPPPRHALYRSIPGENLGRTTLRAYSGMPMEWVYPMPPSSKLSFDLSFWLAPESAQEAMFTVSVTNDYPVSTAPVAATNQYFVAAGDPVRRVHIPVPRQSTSGDVSLRLSVQPLVNSVPSEETPSFRAYWVRPRVRVQIVEFTP